MTKLNKRISAHLNKILEDNVLLKEVKAYAESLTPETAKQVDTYIASEKAFLKFKESN